MILDKTVQIKPTCRLVVLCSDSSVFDMRAMSAIIAYAVALAPSAQRKQTTLTLPDAVEEQYGEDAHMNAVMAALQQNTSSISCISGAASGAAAVRGGILTGKGNKVSKNKKRASQVLSPLATFFANTAASEGLKSMLADAPHQRSRPEWYTVVENPQFGAPIVFISQLPGAEQLEDEDGHQFSTGAQTGSMEFCANLHKALEVIGEDVSTLNLSASEVTSCNSNKDAEAQRAGSREVLVVLSLQDSKQLHALLQSQSLSEVNRIDTRLVVNFVDGRQLSVEAVKAKERVSSPILRNKTTQPVKGRLFSDTMSRFLPPGTKDADGRAANISAAFIGQQERKKGPVDLETTLATASCTQGVAFLCEVFEEGADDKSVWVKRCVQNVLPTLRHVACNMAQYNEWLSSKMHYFLVVAPFLASSALSQQQQEMCTMETTDDGALSIMRRSKASTLAAPRSFYTASSANLLLPVFASDLTKIASKNLLSSLQCASIDRKENWSYYIRERNVRGQWTCASAVRALASQATVLLARQQKPVVVHPTEDVDSDQHVLDEAFEYDKSSKKANDSKDEVPYASLLSQLKKYSLRRTILTTSDARDSTCVDVTENVKPDSNLRSRCSTRTHLSAVDPIAEGERFIPQTALPVDHILDRPTNLPSPEKIEWLTRSFVRKGLGLFSMPQRGRGDVVPHDCSFSLDASENSNAALAMQGLLDEPLNGQTLFVGGDAADKHVMQLIEEDLKRAEEEGYAFEFIKLRDDVIGLFGNLHLSEKLRLSVEHNLTAREKVHILQQIFLEFVALQSRMAGGTLYPAINTQFFKNAKQKPLMHITDVKEQFMGFNLRPFEEVVTMSVAVCRVYEFQLRFGAHLCRLLRCQVPDQWDTLDGTITALCCANAENMHPRSCLKAMMLCGLPIPPEREKRRLWCYYLSGVPSLDQFNMFTNLDKSIASCSANQFEKDSCLIKKNRTPDFGGNLANIICHSLFQNLQNSSQLLILSKSTAERDCSSGGSGDGGVYPREGELNTVLEGRHALYPHDDSVVEVVTTDWSRMCRYVRTTELTCTLHYSIPPPLSTNLGNTVEIISMLSAVASAVNTAMATPQCTLPRDEAVHFTAAFDDGVVFTCKPCWTFKTGTDVVDEVCGNEKKTLNISSNVLKFGEKPCRRTGLSKQSKQREGGGKRCPLKNKPLSGCEDTNASRASPGKAPSSSFLEEEKRQFPVANNGSVLLWTATTKNILSAEATELMSSTVATSQTGITRRIPSLVVTVAGGGITVHNEEHEALLWITRHGSGSFSAPEVIRCMHAYDAGVTWQRTIEVEVRRVVLEDIGAVCRYFYSGVTQVLYPDGAVVTRYPMACSDSGDTRVFTETLVTSTGDCCVRGVKGDDVGRFLRLTANRVQSHTAYDRGHHCRIISRADGVTVVDYFCRNKNYDGYDNYKHCSKENKKNSSIPNLNACHINNACNDQGINDSILLSNVILRVTLHADGTCITTFCECLTKQEDQPNVSSFLLPLIERAKIAGKACDATVRYCIEASSLPSVFLCTSAEAVKDNYNEKREKNKTRLFAGDDCANLDFVGTQNFSSMSLYSSCCQPSSVLGSVMHGESLVWGTDALLSSKQSTKVYDRFYVVFGDGSVLQRSVMHHGRDGNIKPFLHTLFVRPTQTTLRVIHESGLVSVEPVESLCRNAKALSSLAIGEGFAMFDLAHGGMRLVDSQHYVTEVRDLYSNGPVSASITPSCLEKLLRELVLPTYTPHKITRAQLQTKQELERDANMQSRHNRVTGVCAPLTTRLRELCEGFIISNNLLRSDVLNASRVQEGRGVCNANKKRKDNMTVVGWAEKVCWGSKATLFGDKMSAALSVVLSPSESVDVPPAAGVAPLFFSIFEADVVVQYFHERTVEKYVCLLSTETAPVFLSHSIAVGEPGVRQMTFFSMDNCAEFRDNKRTGLEPAVSTCASSHFLATNLRGSNTLTFAQMSNILTGFFLGVAVQRQKALSFFSGTRLPFLTARWLPPTLQPPRRFIRPYFDVSEKDSRAGIQVVSGDLFDNSAADCAPSSYKRLRTFLKFCEITPTAQHIVLSNEVQRVKRFDSMLIYQKAINKLLPERPCVAMEEQRRLCEKYFASATT